MGKIFLQINSAAVAFIDILIAAWEGLNLNTLEIKDMIRKAMLYLEHLKT